MQFDIIRTRDDFLLLQPSWEHIFNENNTANFYLSFDWFNFLLSHSQDFLQDLYIITAESGTEIVAIMPCYLTRRRLCFHHHKSLELIGNVYSPYRGCLVKNGLENVVAHGLVDYLVTKRAGDWQIINFEDLSEKDSFITALKTAFEGKGLSFYEKDNFVNIVLDFSSFPNSETYFRSIKKHFREEIKRHINMMNRNGGFDILLPLDEEHDIETTMNDYYDIYSKSWKKTEGDPLFHRQLAKYLLKKGNLRLFILYSPEDQPRDGLNPVFPSYQSSIIPERPGAARGIPVAANFFILYGKQAYFLKTSYREDYSKYSPGNILMWFSFKHLLEVEHVNIVDYQKDYEKHKIQFGGVINEKRYQMLICNSNMAHIDLKCRDKLSPLVRRVRQEFVARHDKKEMRDIKSAIVSTSMNNNIMP